MGMDMHVRLAKYNKETNLYDELVLYRPGETYHYSKTGEKIIDDPNYERVLIYDGRNSEMFIGMKNGDEEDGYGDFPWTSIALSSLEPKFRKDIEEYMSSAGFFDFYELTLADMKLYTLDHPYVTDYNSEEEGKKKVNPIVALFADICKYASLVDNWDWNFTPLSNYKVIFYFDW